MKWTYSIKNKLLASLSLLALGVLVLVSNYIDRNHTENVKNAISTLYEDRLIAEEYILKMTTGVYQIREALNSESESKNQFIQISNLLLSINEENNAFLKTRFTTEEKRIADELILILEEFKSIHLQDKQTNLETVSKALTILNQLSNIQLEESKQIMADAETLYISGKTSSQFVFAIIIIIILVLQALVFTTKTLHSNTKSKFPNLN